MIMKVNIVAEEVVKEMLWLAWRACGRPSGMGVLQDRPGATKDEVWKNALVAGDYPSRSGEKKGRIYADYVFGRMMKLLLDYTEDTIAWSNYEPSPDYQGWCGKYLTVLALAEAALSSCGANGTIIGR